MSTMVFPGIVFNMANISQREATFLYTSKDWKTSDNLTKKRYSEATLQTHKEEVCSRYSYTNMNRPANYVNSVAAPLCIWRGDSSKSLKTLTNYS